MASRNLFILGLIAIFFVGLFVGSLPTSNTPPQIIIQSALPTPIPLAIASRIWELVQNWRVYNKLTPYTEDPKLCAIADQRVLEIQTDWSHNGWYKFNNLYPYMAENLAYGYSSEETLTKWLYSEEHAVNLRFNYKLSCLRCSNGYCAQEFGSK